jgi:ribonuclease HI
MSEQDLLIDFYDYIKNNDGYSWNKQELQQNILLFLKTTNICKNIKTVYTDGACSGNGRKNSKGGIGIYMENICELSIDFSDIRTLFKDKHGIDLGEATNNKCELLGIYLVLKNLHEYKNDNEKLIIKTDSMYSIKCCTVWYDKWKKDNWFTSTGKPVSNKELVILIAEMLKNNKGIVSLEYTKGHSQKPSEFSKEYNDWYGNFMADKLATDVHNKK